MGLSFPPLELGSSTSLLNVSISILDTDCWNGSNVGSYTIDVTETNKTTWVSTVPSCIIVISKLILLCFNWTLGYDKVSTIHFQIIQSPTVNHNIPTSGPRLWQSRSWMRRCAGTQRSVQQLRK